MSQLTEKDWNDAHYSRQLLDNLHAPDFKRPAPGFIWFLETLSFILTGLQDIFFNKKGKPKNMVALGLSIPAMVRFAKEVITRIKEGVKPKVVSAEDEMRGRGNARVKRIP